MRLFECAVDAPLKSRLEKLLGSDYVEQAKQSLGQNTVDFVTADAVWDMRRATCHQWRATDRQNFYSRTHNNISLYDKY